jgi:hypothetical protein
MAVLGVVQQTGETERRSVVVRGTHQRRQLSGLPCGGVVIVAVLERPVYAATVCVIGQLRASATSALRRAVTALLRDGELCPVLNLTALTRRFWSIT